MEIEREIEGGEREWGRTKTIGIWWDKIKYSHIQREQWSEAYLEWNIKVEHMFTSN